MPAQIKFYGGVKVTSINDLKEQLDVKQAEVRELEKQLRAKEYPLVVEARKRLLKEHAMVLKTQEIGNEELGRMSRGILFRDVLDCLKQDFQMQITCDPEIYDNSLAEVICLFHERKIPWFVG